MGSKTKAYGTQFDLIGSQNKDEPSLKRKLTFVLLIKSWNMGELTLTKKDVGPHTTMALKKRRFYKQIFTPTMALAGTQEYKNAPKKNETRVERERRTMRGDVEFQSCEICRFTPK